MKKIAILGASGYIGRSLVDRFSQEKKDEVFAFSRSTEKARKIIDPNLYRQVKIKSIKEFSKYKYDVIINCAGMGNPAVLKKDPEAIFKVTEEYDNLILDYLRKSPKTLYINFSSGAVYGKNAGNAVEEKTLSSLDINRLNSDDFYAIAKINSEAKHRAVSELHIVDLRVFSFFSRFLDLSSNFFIADLINCIKSKKVLETKKEDFVRDFVTTDDLFNLINIVIKKPKMNDLFEVYSRKPVSKFELLKYFEKNFKLKYEFVDNLSESSPTGSKSRYFSKNKKAASIGYSPKYTSLEGIEKEVKALLA